MGVSPDERASASSRGASPSPPRAAEPAAAASSVGAQRALFPPTTEASSTASGDPALGDDPIARANAAVAAARETARLRSEEYAKARAEAERYAAAAEALAARDRARTSAEPPDVRESANSAIVAKRDDDDDHDDDDHDHHDANDAAGVSDVDADAASDATTIVAADRLPDVPANAEAEAEADVSSSSSADPNHHHQRRHLLGQHHARKRWSPARGSVDMLRARPAATVSNAAGVLILADAEARGRRPSSEISADRSSALATPPRKPAVPRFPRKRAASRPTERVHVNPNPKRKPSRGFLALGVAERDDEHPRGSRRADSDEDEAPPADDAFAARRLDAPPPPPPDDPHHDESHHHHPSSSHHHHDPSSQPIAFVGVGSFGAPIAARLMDRGFPVVLAPGATAAGRRRASTLANHGAASARSPRHAAELLMGKTTTSRLPRAWNPGVRARDARDAARLGSAPSQPSPLMIFCLPDESSFRDAFEATFPRDTAAEDADRETFGARLTVLNLTPMTPLTTRRAADRCAALGVNYAHAAVRGDATDAEEGTLRLWIAARDAKIPGIVAFAGGGGVDRSKDAVAHCSAATAAFAESTTRLGDDPAAASSDALVDAQRRAERRVVARATVRMAWRLESLRVQLETARDDSDREKTRAGVAEARLAEARERADALDERCTVATERASAAERESSRLERTLADVEDGARRWKTLADERERRVEALEKALEKATNDAETSANLAERARIAEASRDALEARVETLADELRDARLRAVTDANEWAMRRAETEASLEEALRDAARERDVLEEALRRCAASEEAATTARAAAETYRRERDDATTAARAAEAALRGGDRAACETTARLRERLAEAEEALAAANASSVRAAAETTALRALADRDDADKIARESKTAAEAAARAETNERLAAAVADAESRAAAAEAAAASTARRLDAARCAADAAAKAAEEKAATLRAERDAAVAARDGAKAAARRATRTRERREAELETALAACRAQLRRRDARRDAVERPWIHPDRNPGSTGNAGNTGNTGTGNTGTGTGGDDARDGRDAHLAAASPNTLTLNSSDAMTSSPSESSEARVAKLRRLLERERCRATDLEARCATLERAASSSAKRAEEATDSIREKWKTARQENARLAAERDSAKALARGASDEAAKCAALARDRAGEAARLGAESSAARRDAKTLRVQLEDANRRAFDADARAARERTRAERAETAKGLLDAELDAMRRAVMDVSAAETTAREKIGAAEDDREDANRRVATAESDAATLRVMLRDAERAVESLSAALRDARRGEGAFAAETERRFEEAAALAAEAHEHRLAARVAEAAFEIDAAEARAAIIVAEAEEHAEERAAEAERRAALAEAVAEAATADAARKTPAKKRKDVRRGGETAVDANGNADASAERAGTSGDDVAWTNDASFSFCDGSYSKPLSSRLATSFAGDSLASFAARSSSAASSSSSGSSGDDRDGNANRREGNRTVAKTTTTNDRVSSLREVSPAVATAADRARETMAAADAESAVLAPTRRALELLVAAPDARRTLQLLRDGVVDPSPATALACLLASLVFRDGFDHGFEAITPGTVRDALERSGPGDGEVGDGDETQTRTRTGTRNGYAATRIVAAFEAIRASLDPDDVLRRMRGARLAEEDDEGLDRCVGAIRAMIAGGFVEGDASRGEPLADALFRWSACAVRAWKLNRRRAELARELDVMLEDAAANGSEDRSTATTGLARERARRKKQPLVVRAGKSSTDAKRSARASARNVRGRTS